MDVDVKRVKVGFEFRLSYSQRYLVLGLVGLGLTYCNGYRVATRSGFRGMSRICAMLSRVPASPAPGRQISRISRCSQNENNDLKNKKKNSNNRRDISSNLI